MSPDPATRSERIRKASAERRASRRLGLRRTILEAATGLFVEHGYERFSLRQVAEAIGYSPTAIYLHFADKDELLLHVAFEGFARFGEDLEEAYEGSDDPLERLSAVGRAYMSFGLSHPVHYRLMFMQRSELLELEPPEGYESIVDAFEFVVRALGDCVEAGVVAVPEGLDLRDLARLAWSHAHGLVALAISVVDFGEKEALRTMDAHMKIFLDGVRAGAGEGGN